MARSLQAQFDSFVKSQGGVSGVAAEEAQQILAEQTARMATILKSKLPEDKFSTPISTSEDTAINAGVGDTVELSGWVEYDEGAVHRESWYQEAYGQGADLFTLFNFGYNARDYVYGPNGQRSKISREGLDFIEKALEEFNSGAPEGVTAVRCM